MSPEDNKPFLIRDPFLLAVLACSQFVVLTLGAMLFYPGGELGGVPTQGYRFFTNFFSALGYTRTPTGQANTVSAILFFIALLLAGLGLALFFVAFARLFTHTRLLRWLSRAGTLSGVLSGLCFIGVAFTPANLLRPIHLQFVLWAFRFFPLAAGLYTLVIFLAPHYPRRYGFVFLGFTFLLVLYLLLLTQGPDPYNSLEGRMIQATGQKLIVYAAILSVLVQAWGARKTRVDPP
ncbi:MAG: hypothetical protein AB1894_18940 [Chloroflexota bacterium]